jgi:hypothetical protein
VIFQQRQYVLSQPGGLSCPSGDRERTEDEMRTILVEGGDIVPLA